jgi:hypothetical protein
MRVRIFTPEFRFALLVFLSDYHGGQWSRGYRLLSKIQSRWKPRNITSELCAELRETEEYQYLVDRYADKV